ncbi:MAG: outer membrane beta-barrel protein [Nitrospira sp.]|nr:outer membrane beta-barrel protein [Nitrospira sp.]
MYRSIILAVALSILWAPAALAQEGAWTGNVNAFLGAKSLDEDDWEPVEDHAELGLKLDFRQRAWPVNIAIDFMFSFDEEDLLGVNIEGETFEVNLGVRKIWDQGLQVRPFIGGGISFIGAEFKGSGFGGSASDDDTAVGFWIDGGVYWTLTEHFNLGLELGFSKAEVTLFNIDGEAGGVHFGALAGYHF